MRVTLVLAIITWVAILAPAAEATPSTGTLTFNPPGLASGRLISSVRGGSYLAAYGTSGGHHLALTIQSNQLHLVLHHTWEDFVYVGPNKVCAPCGPQSEPPQVIEGGPGTLSITDVLANMTFVVRPEVPAQVAMGNATIDRIVRDAVLSSNGTRYSNSLEPFSQSAASWPNWYLVQAEGPGQHVRSDALGLAIQGRMDVVLSGATLELRNKTGPQTLKTGTWTETSPGDPTGASQARVRHHHVTLVADLTGTLVANYTGPYAHVVASTVEIQNVASLSVPLANATLDLGDQSYQSSGQPYLDVKGDFTVRLPDAGTNPNDAILVAQLEGEIQSVTENRAIVRTWDAATLAAATAGLSLLVVVIVVVSWVRRGAVWIAAKALEVKLLTFAPFAARLELGRVLEHPVRKGIMEMLAGPHAMRPLADLRREIAAAFGISTMAAYFHLRTLWNARQLTVVHVGRQHYIGPNSGGMGPREQRVAAGLLQEPIGLAIAEQVCARPGSSQSELIAGVNSRLSRSGLPAVTEVAIRKWIRKFEAITVQNPSFLRAFGTSLNPEADASFSTLKEVRLLQRFADATDRRLVRYNPSDVLYDVLKAFLERRPELGVALADLTRLRVQRRSAPSPASA